MSHNDDYVCSEGYSTDTTSCSYGYTLVTNGQSGGKACGKCEESVCDEGTKTTITEESGISSYCSSGSTPSVVGKSGPYFCIKCRETCRDKNVCYGKVQRCNETITSCKSTTATYYSNNCMAYVRAGLKTESYCNEKLQYYQAQCENWAKYDCPACENGSCVQGSTDYPEYSDY